MQTLLIDPFHGAAGDMIIGALLSLIDDKEPVLQAMASVVEYPDTKMVKRCGISALKIYTKAQKTHRTSEEVTAIIKKAQAPPEVIDRALSIFERIRKAEAKVHGYEHSSESEDEHHSCGNEHHKHHNHGHHDHTQQFFHEVGADDAIADLIGSSMALHLLNPDRIVVLPVVTGKGTVHIEHGIVPVPAPATAAILEESSLITHLGGTEDELLTPTGAAILSEIATDTSNWNTEILKGTIEGIGYGAGTRDDKHSPNVIRMILLEQNGEEAVSHLTALSHHEIDGF